MIGHVNFTDQGLYRCVASNPAGSATAAATLSVTGKEPVKLDTKIALVIFTDTNVGA